MPALATLMRRALHVVLPVDCSSCGVSLDEDPVPFFCRPCWASIQPLRGPACPRCGRPFASTIALTYSPDHLCTACRLRRPAFTRAWSCYPYEGPLQDAIRMFKYHSKVALADALGELMGRAIRDSPD
ncbi:MAG: ComF family protein, partial [Nitrospiraceae bacterium]